MRAPVMVEIHERLAAGDTCYAIAHDFAVRNVPRYRKEDGSEGTGQWSRERVHRLVRDDFACGRWLADKKRMVYVDVPRLVSDELAAKARSTLVVNRTVGLRKKVRGVYLLEGRAVCGVCGAPMRIRWMKRARRGLRGRVDVPHYICASRKRRELVRCEAPLVIVAQADARVWERIVEVLNEPDLPAMLAGLRSERAAESHDWEADVRGYRTHLAKLERKEATVLAQFRRDLISEAALERELGELRRERRMVTDQLDAAERARQATHLDGERLQAAEALVAQWRSKLANATPEIRRDVVALLVGAGDAVFRGRDVELEVAVPRLPSAAAGDAGGGSSGALVSRSFKEAPHEGTLRIRVVA